MSESCCNIPRASKHPTLEEQSQKSTLYLKIQGMNCQNCVNRVRNSVLSTYGVTSVLIEQVSGLAEIIFNASLTTTDALLNAVRSAGGDGKHEYSPRLLSLE